MGYSRSAGSCEGAVLVFAHNAKEARILIWHNGLVVEDWIDTAVKLMRNSVWLYDEMVSQEPHVIDSPKVCVMCELWGNELNENDVCTECVENMEAE